MEPSLLASAGVSTTTMVVLFVGYKVFQLIRGHRFISDCCGRRGEVSFDVRDVPPSPPKEMSSPQPSLLSAGVKPQSLSVIIPEQTEHRKEKETVSVR